jgi:hypothetical protein
VADVSAKDAVVLLPNVTSFSCYTFTGRVGFPVIALSLKYWYVTVIALSLKYWYVTGRSHGHWCIEALPPYSLVRNSYGVGVRLLPQQSRHFNVIRASPTARQFSWFVSPPLPFRASCN